MRVPTAGACLGIALEHQKIRTWALGPERVGKQADQLSRGVQHFLRGRERPVQLLDTVIDLRDEVLPVNACESTHRFFHTASDGVQRDRQLRQRRQIHRPVMRCECRNVGRRRQGHHRLTELVPLFCDDTGGREIIRQTDGQSFEKAPRATLSGIRSRARFRRERLRRSNGSGLVSLDTAACASRRCGIVARRCPRASMAWS